MNQNSKKWVHKHGNALKQCHASEPKLNQSQTDILNSHML